MADVLDRATVLAQLGRVVTLVASGDDDPARAMLRDLCSVYCKERQQTLPGLPSPSSGPSAAELYRAASDRLFSYWKATCNHPQARQVPERARAVLARLREGFTEAEIMCAIDGAAAEAYVNPQTSKKYDDLELICRNGGKLEDFRERGERAGSTHASGVAGPVSGGDDVEAKISRLRSEMSALRRAGRDTEYDRAAAELDQLVAARRKA